MLYLFIKIILIFILAILSYVQFDKSSKSFSIVLIFITLFIIVSIIIDIIDYKNKIGSDGEIKKLTSELTASGKIQTLQLRELNQLRNKTDLLQELSKTQLKAIFYTEELNQNIGTVLLRFKLKEKYLFQDLCPFWIIFELATVSNDKIKYRELIENGDTHRVSGNNDLLTESYHIYQIQDDGKCIGPNIQGHFNIEVENLVRKFDFPPDAGKIKDFHDEKIYLWVSESLLDNVIFIELVVNGWAIFHRNIDKTEWRKVNISDRWPEFKNKDLVLFRNWKDENTPTYPGWKMNLYNDIPTKHEAGTSRWPDY